MKEKISQYKGLILIMIVIGVQLGWNVYQKEAFNDGMKLTLQNGREVFPGSSTYKEEQILLKEKDNQQYSEEESRSKSTFTNKEEILDSTAISYVSKNEKSRELKEGGELVEDVNSGVQTSQSAPKEKVPIYVCGAIKTPGVYYVWNDAIVNEVIECAGGMTEEADQKRINLARPIQAYEKIVVPIVGEEIDKLKDSYENRERIETIETIPNKASIENRLSTSKEEAGLININTATKEELMTLNGIGAAKAQAIIQYRLENGGFNTMDEMMQISGIGEKTFEKIKQFITT